MGESERTKRFKANIKDIEARSDPSVKMMTDQMKATAQGLDRAIAKLVQAKGDPPLVAMNKGWCLGCKQRGGECQCAEIGTEPEWVDYEP